MATTVTTSSISYGETITYRIDQVMNTLGVNCIDRYSSLKFSDVLPAGITPSYMYMYINGKYICQGVITISSNGRAYGSIYLNLTNANVTTSLYFGSCGYSTTTRELNFNAGSDFLSKTLTMTGETITIYITATLTDSTVTQLTNTASWIINGVEITSNKVITPVVNRQSFNVYYYREGTSGGWEQVYVQSVKERDTLSIPTAATTAATRSNCAGFTGWYMGDPQVNSSTKVESGSVTISGNLYLYGRNYCTVQYKTATNSASQTVVAHSLFSDQALTVPATAESTYPASQTVYWGQTVELSGSATLYYSDAGRARRVKSCSGAYINDPSAGGIKAVSATVTENCIAYKAWSGTMYDGVIARR